MSKKPDQWLIDLEDRRAREDLRSQANKMLGNAIEHALYKLRDATRKLDDIDDPQEAEKLLVIAQLASETISNIARAEHYGASRILADFGDRGDKFSKDHLAYKFGDMEDGNAKEA